MTPIASAKAANRVSIAALQKRRIFRLRTPSRTIVLGPRTLVMGVLNVTPDSFSDGGNFLDRDAAVARGIAMEAASADIIDVGGESTRPGSAAITVEEELRRILPVIEGLRREIRIPISVDTSKSAVARAAIGAGAEILNDVTALRDDPRMAEVAAKAKVPLILMHMRGTPATMQKGPFSRDVLRDVKSGLSLGVKTARKFKVPQSQIVLDPGIGFGKTAQQNCELIARLAEIAALGFPVLIGTSRKSFIRKIVGGDDAMSRLGGTAATVAASVLNGAHIVRVHDVVEMVQVVRMADAIRDPASIAKLASRKS
jgi:dihydropteroate synthase